MLFIASVPPMFQCFLTSFLSLSLSPSIAFGNASLYRAPLLFIICHGMTLFLINRKSNGQYTHLCYTSMSSKNAPGTPNQPKIVEQMLLFYRWLTKFSKSWLEIRVQKRKIIGKFLDPACLAGHLPRQQFNILYRFICSQE